MNTLQLVLGPRALPNPIQDAIRLPSTILPVTPARGLRVDSFLERVLSAFPVESSGGIRFDTFQVEPVRVLADPSRLTQVLHNFASAAALRSACAGVVSVGAHRLDGHTVRVSFSDAGALPDEDPFDASVLGMGRADATLSKEVSVQLFVAANFVRAEGGEVGYGRDGERTCLWLQLPAAA